MRKLLLSGLMAFTMALSGAAAALADAPPEWRRMPDGEDSIILIDTANIKRDGDLVTINATIIPAKALDYRGSKAVMLTMTDRFDCKARTRTGIKVALYDLTGAVIDQAVFTTPDPREIGKDTNAEVALNAVCGKDGLPTGPVITDLMAERAAWLETR